MKKNILLFIFFVKSMFGFTQTLTISVLDNQFKIDETRSLIVSQIENIESYSDLSNYTEVIINLDQQEFTFNSIPNSLGYTSSYTLSKLSDQYTLYFTQLPIISIETQETIIDEPKVLASFSYSDDEQILTSNIGIEIRGGSSQSYPKKSYDLEFWEDEIGNESYDVQFKQMRSDDDWILDGLYNEPLRLRSFLANKLWLEMHAPYYEQEEPEAKSGVDVMYVELFLNGDYNGVYNLSEKIDKQQLKLKSFNGDIRGELYKGISWGASTFISLPGFNNNNRKWGGYEMKYPKEEDTTTWQSLYDFTDFVINSSDADFSENIWNKFNYENYLDYFIFLNLIRATDNTGKNIYIAKYNTNEPYYYIPWDLDGCFGTIWNGTNSNITDDILRNRFHRKVIRLNHENYTDVIADKWFGYRDNILGTNNLIQTFEDQFNFLTDQKLYEREALVFPNYSFNQEDLSYLTSWLQDRLYFLDLYFNGLVSVDNLKINESDVIIFPNPASDKIYFKEANDLLGKQYSIYDVLGNLVKSESINTNFISIEKLNQGYYILVLKEKAYKLIVK